MKHYKSVEFLSNFRMSGPPDKRKAPLLTVLSLLLHILSTRSLILPKWNKRLNIYVRSGVASPKFWVGQNV